MLLLLEYYIYYIIYYSKLCRNLNLSQRLLISIVRNLLVNHLFSLIQVERENICITKTNLKLGLIINTELLVRYEISSVKCKFNLCCSWWMPNSV